jgi:hypothetical protein
MVLVEAAPAQIEMILATCAQDTKAIEAVAIDPSASGTNLLPEKQRLLGFQQYERAADNRAEIKGYSITPEQQGVIAALNSLPISTDGADTQNSAGVASATPQQQGWATKLRADQQPHQLKQLENEVNQRHNQYLGQARQQHAEKKLAKDKTITEQPMRVLFLLHSSEESAAKK